MVKSSQYNETYFENGVAQGVSGYQNYRWMPEQTISMCESITRCADISKRDAILDYGCAKGFVVRGFTELGYDCEGADISAYAIESSSELVRPKLHLLDPESASEQVSKMRKDVIVCKDVLEHIPYELVQELVASFHSCAPKLFAVVPLAVNGRYVIPDYENDVTHIIREDKNWWTQVFEKVGYKVSFATRVPGVKENWSHFPGGNGFFMCTR